MIHGQVCIRGTRIPASLILGSLADGMTTDEILADLPPLTSEAISAALASAAALASKDPVAIDPVRNGQLVVTC